MPAAESARKKRYEKKIQRVHWAAYKQRSVMKETRFFFVFFVCLFVVSFVLMDLFKTGTDEKKN